ncbi:EAL domain-containing protein [Klebsiella pneumoniae]|uniref:EAL domain-containing protein n=1 Tax=Klebsiella pneumoniae TaxID=573 RepID=UPI001E2AFBC3|nr:EAL domain-containing protein [Klebsiella pneumoniae]
MHRPVSAGLSARYDIETSRIAAVEALVRWQHPRLGLLMPYQFIPLAEETGLIVAMSDVVLEKACKDMVHLSPDLVISVNISAVEFNTRGGETGKGCAAKIGA